MRSKAPICVLRREFGCLYGNQAEKTTYFETGFLNPSIVEKLPYGERRSGCRLNPRRNNDVLTYPHLNEIGFFAGERSREYKNYNLMYRCIII